MNLVVPVVLTACSDRSLLQERAADDGMEFGTTHQALSCSPNCEFDLPVPAGYVPADFILSAGERLHVNDFAKMHVARGSPDGDLAPIANVGNNVTMVGAAGARVDGIMSNAFTQVRSFGLVDGDLLAPSWEI